MEHLVIVDHIKAARAKVPQAFDTESDPRFRNAAMARIRIGEPILIWPGFRGAGFSLDQVPVGAEHDETKPRLKFFYRVASFNCRDHMRANSSAFLDSNSAWVTSPASRSSPSFRMIRDVQRGRLRARAGGTAHRPRLARLLHQAIHRSPNDLESWLPRLLKLKRILVLRGWARVSATADQRELDVTKPHLSGIAPLDSRYLIYLEFFVPFRTPTVIAPLRPECLIILCETPICIHHCPEPQRSTAHPELPSNSPVASVAPPTQQSATPPTQQSATPPTQQSATPPTQQSATPPTQQSATPPTQQSATPPTQQSATPPTQQSATPPTQQSATPPTQQSATPPTPRRPYPPHEDLCDHHVGGSDGQLRRSQNTVPIEVRSSAQSSSRRLPEPRHSNLPLVDPRFGLADGQFEAREGR